MMSLPLVIEGKGDALAERVRRCRDEYREALRAHGALLLRGFGVGGADGFEEVVRGLSGDPLAYSERSSPRSVIKGNVYTSTDYPSDQEIFLHNENSYQAVWPLVLYFYCIKPPLTMGATPLADTRAVLDSIDPAVRAEFIRRKWMVTRNYQEELGLPWQDAFNTQSREEVLRYCERAGIEARWDGDRLRTRAIRKPVHRHPVTGSEVWFNHIIAFHVSSLPQTVRRGLLEMFGEENLPSNTYYGDGSAIPDDVLDHLRSCYRLAATRFDYRGDDVLIVDNMLVSHGREPFTGARKVAVAMAEPSGG